MGIEQLFEEAQQVYDIDALIQAIAADGRELSGPAISKDKTVQGNDFSWALGRRKGDGWSARDEIRPTPASRPKAGLQPIVRQHSVMPVALHAVAAFIAKLFGRKALAGRW